MRTIVTITGTRSDWGLMGPVREAIAGIDGLEQICILTGMHLLPRFSEDRARVRRDFPGLVHEVDMLCGDDSNAGMACALGNAIHSMTPVLGSVRPDIVLLQGDRGEMLAGAIVAAHLNVPIVHMSGGDRSGTIDDSIRHAISTFSHIHLTTCESSTRTLLQRGEPHGRILTTGEPGVDLIMRTDFLERTDLCKELGLVPENGIIIVAQHPVTTESDAAAAQMRATLEAVSRFARKHNMQVVVTAANSDAGGEAMNAIIAEYASEPCFRIHTSLGSRLFLSLQSEAAVLVGNSSSGIWEAPSFGLPAVNIGTRQHGRLRATNVIDVPCHQVSDIISALETATTDEVFRKAAANAVNPYGDGQAGKRTARILAELDLADKTLVAKWLDSGRDYLGFAR